MKAEGSFAEAKIYHFFRKHLISKEKEPCEKRVVVKSLIVVFT